MLIDGGLRKIFREHIPRAHWTSVETGGTGLGVPDSHGCVNGSQFWIEFKKTDGWAVALRPEQVAWHMSYGRHGGTSFIGVRRLCEAGARREAADQLWLLPGDQADQWKLCGLPRGLEDVYCLGQGGPARWDWDQIILLLTGGSRSK